MVWGIYKIKRQELKTLYFINTDIVIAEKHFILDNIFIIFILTF